MQLFIGISYHHSSFLPQDISEKKTNLSVGQNEEHLDGLAMECESIVIKVNSFKHGLRRSIRSIITYQIIDIVRRRIL